MDNIHTSFTPARNPAIGLRADVLGGEVRDAVANGGKRGDDQIIQFHGGGVACGDADTEAVDTALNQDVSYGDKGLLQDAGDGDRQYFSQQIP